MQVNKAELAGLRAAILCGSVQVASDSCHSRLQRAGFLRIAGPCLMEATPKGRQFFVSHLRGQITSQINPIDSPSAWHTLAAAQNALSLVQTLIKVLEITDQEERGTRRER